MFVNENFAYRKYSQDVKSSIYFSFEAKYLFICISVPCTSKIKDNKQH